MFVQPKKPVLSLLISSRNDRYMGNSLWRLQTALNYIAQSVHEVGRVEEVEILVTDWGSEIPLHTVLRLSPTAARLVSFLLVPPTLARELQGDSPFSEVYAYNAAARRAHGLYLGRIDQDTLVGSRFLKFFFDLYEGKTNLDIPLESALMLSNRRQIPYRFASRCPSFLDVDRFIRWFGGSLGGEMFHLPQHLFLRSLVGIWLVHREAWYQCGGYNERMKYYNWMETEMALRLMQRGYKVVDLGKLVNYDFYHLEHYLPGIPWAGYASNRRQNPLIDLENPPVPEFHPNSAEWGLIQYPLEIATYWITQANGEIATREEQQFKWPRFLLLLLSTGILIVWDKMLIVVYLWKHRFNVVWDAVRGQSINNWPGKLKRIWIERQARLRRGTDQ